jgi:hypothetical protein
MSTKGSAANLVSAAKDLALEWEQTKSSWNDIKSQEFEQKYLEDLPGHVRRAAARRPDDRGNRCRAAQDQERM